MADEDRGPGREGPQDEEPPEKDESGARERRREREGRGAGRVRRARVQEVRDRDQEDGLGGGEQEPAVDAQRGEVPAPEERPDGEEENHRAAHVGPGGNDELGSLEGLGHRSPRSERIQGQAQRCWTMLRAGRCPSKTPPRTTRARVDGVSRRAACTVVAAARHGDGSEPGWHGHQHRIGVRHATSPRIAATGRNASTKLHGSSKSARKRTISKSHFLIVS